MRILTSSFIFFFGTFCTVVITALLNYDYKIGETFSWMVAVVLFVFVVLLTARHMFGGKPQRTENHYVFKEKDCDHCFFPEGNPPIGQRCSFCGKFNSLKDLGMKSVEEWQAEIKEHYNDL